MQPYCQQDGITLYNADCRTALAELPAESVQMVITSPPYWALRKYAGVEPSVWDGDAGCQHEWGQPLPPHHPGQVPQTNKDYSTPGVAADGGNAASGSFCHLCSAWRGTLGNEPTPDLYLSHLVGIFRLCRRVLRDDGVMVVNMGDSYCTRSVVRDNGNRDTIKAIEGDTSFPTWAEYSAAGRTRDTKVITGLPEKNLLLMPFRLALALQADGWVIRSVMPWVKANCLPESVTDRPTNAIEYLFLLSKGQRYVWDAEAIRRGFVDERMGDPGDYYPDYSLGAGRHDAGTKNAAWERGRLLGGRNYRNSDPFFDSLQMVTRGGGLLLDSDGGAMALQVNPMPLSAAHFAAYPPKLVEPFVLAAAPLLTCATCGKPWQRIVDRQSNWQERKRNGATAGNLGASATYQNGVHGKGMTHDLDALSIVNLGFRPACAHDALTVPATILDPFSGAGTSILVAQRLGRRGIGIEVSQEYCAITKERLRVGLPLDELAANEPQQLEMEV